MTASEGLNPNDLRTSNQTSSSRRNFYPKEPVEPVLEITSPFSADGKTSLLYYTTAQAILPIRFDGIVIDGKQSAVVFLDTDCRFDAVRLRDIAVQIIQDKANAQSISVDVLQNNKLFQDMLVESLRHVHVFRPQSSLELLTTLKGLDTYLLYNSERHTSSTRPLHSILLDSASAFYWQDRREAEILRTPGVSEEREKATASYPTNTTTSNRTNLKTRSIPHLHHDIVTCLRNLQRTFSCIVIFTTWGLYRDSPLQGRRHHQLGSSYPYQSHLSSAASFCPYLPGPWAQYPTCRVVVQRDPVKPFPPGLSLEEIKGDAPSRQQVVRKGLFHGWLDHWGKEGWPSGIAEAVQKLDMGGSFKFWVVKEGVGIVQSEGL